MLTLPEKILFLLVLAGASAYFALRIRLLVRLLQASKPLRETRTDQMPRRIVGMLADVFLQRRVLRKPVTGFFHLLIVWGFFVFAVNTVNHFAGAFLPGFHLFGATVVADAYAAMADVFAVLIIIGVLGLAVRRYLFRPPGLTPKSVESAIVFAFIGGAMAAYLLANAAEMAFFNHLEGNPHIIAVRLARLFSGLNTVSLLVLAHAAWWSDALMHLALIALLVIPTKHLHLAAGPVNLAFQRSRPTGQMEKVNLEDETAETFGVANIGEFTWKQNLDLYACIECGRCRDYCPTATSNKALNPKALIVDLKDHLINDGPALLLAKKQEPNGAEAPSPALIGDIVKPEAIWACTTCGNCVEHCPMGIEHIDKLTDMRTHLTLVQADFPQEAAVAFRNMETAGNPWGFAPTERARWADGLHVPIMADKKEAEILWWVGCSGSYDERSKKISEAMAKILAAARVDYAILGNEERCNCESARRLGNEYLYQTATQEILDTLRQYKFKRILAACPHCYNTLKNEYPDFDGKFEVIHHSEFIRELLETNQLSLNSGNSAVQTVFHDSCYLGRHNGIYDAPRAVLEAAGCAMVAAEREKTRGFCCGAGGGQMWLEEQGDSISGIRTEELLKTGATQLAAACPFCITMLSDGLKHHQSSAPVLDIAEIIAARLET